MGRRERRQATALARKHPDRFEARQFRSTCWACGRFRTLFAEGGQIRLRNDCACLPEGGRDGTCPTCDVVGGHAHLCPKVAKPKGDAGGPSGG
jgi:hypothetical protein